jgi:hypothetical protein
VVTRILKLLLPRTAGRSSLKAIGQEALDKQPDSIRLRRRSFTWQKPALVQNLTGPLLARSFSEVGDFSIAEMPDLKVRFFVRPANSIYACVYEHAKLGTWFDLVSRYQDGSVAIFGTARDPGTEHRPQDMVVYAPELSADMLYTRMLKERPERTLVGVNAGSVVKLFQDTYKEQMEWRKKRGAQAAEVAEPIAGGAQPELERQVS